MSWISLASARSRLRDILEYNLDDDDYHESSYSVVDAADGRDALLIGNYDEFIESEIRRAEYFLEDYENNKKPPPPAVMSQILSFAVIASLGETDYSWLFQSIGESKHYKNPWEKSLQLIVKRIIKTEASPDKSFEKRGHITKDDQWFRLVETAPTSHAFNLAVCPDHARWSFLCSYVLPLSFLLCQERKKDDWKTDLKELLKWGGPSPEKAGKIVYERNAERPDSDIKAIASDKKTVRGFDAVEIKDREIRAYYYLGYDWDQQIILSGSSRSHDLLEQINLDWGLVEEDVSAGSWAKIAKLKARCVYVIVYDARRFPISESDVAGAEKYYDLSLVARDITQI